MKLKISKNRDLLFAGILLLITLALLSLKTVTDKSSKYVSAPEFEQKTPLNFIQLTFGNKQYDKLKEKRDKAVSVKILETKDSDYVPATITYNGTEYRAEVRLKGDWTDHLQGDKWSFRIKLKDDKTILGMRKFSIHHPKTRGYINEWLYHKVIKEEEIIGLRYGFLEGAVHIKQENSSNFVNKEVGIYAIEETFDKRTVESNKRKESVILKFTEDYWWSEVKKSLSVGRPSGIHWSRFMTGANLPISMFSESKMLQDSTMFDYFKLSKNLLHQVRAGEIPISEVFDLKKLALQNALLNLFGGTHGNYIINLRFYYNPITSKLEPIAFDGNSGERLEEYVDFFFLREEKDSVYLKELAYAIEKVAKPDYLQSFLDVNQEEISEYEKLFKKEFRTTGLSLDNLEHNQGILKSELIELKEKYNLEDIEIPLDAPTEKDLKHIEISLPETTSWVSKNELMSKTTLSYSGNAVYKLNRESLTEPAYTTVNNIKAKKNSFYKTSIIAKKGDNSNYLGLRISGIYPDRVDAVFDLDKGVVDGMGQGGSFRNENASIEALGDGWYQCTLSGKVNTNNIKILFGPTNKKARTRSWESKIDEECDVYIVPLSLMVEELVN